MPIFEYACKECGAEFDALIQGAALGVPQKRRRLVLIASIFGEVALLPKTHSSGQNDLKPYPTVEQVIGSLPAIADGQVFDKDPLHRAWELSAVNKERMKQSLPGGTWLGWDPDLRAPCYRKPSGQTYKSVYVRMEWDKPAPTITTQFYNFGTGRFGHPEQDRAPSLREGALRNIRDHDHRNRGI